MVKLLISRLPRYYCNANDISITYGCYGYNVADNDANRVIGDNEDYLSHVDRCVFGPLSARNNAHYYASANFHPCILLKAVARVMCVMYDNFREFAFK